MERFVCMTLTAHNAALYGATLFGTSLVKAYFPASDLAAELVSTVALAPVMLIFAEVIPKSLFQAFGDSLMRWSSPLLWLTDKLLFPVVALLLGMVAFWQSRARRPGRAAPHRRNSAVSQFAAGGGTKEGVITPQQDVIVRNILELRHRPVRQIMTPMSHVQMLRVDMDARQARREIARFSHARLPVYEGNPSNVVGSLRMLDFLCERKGRHTTIAPQAAIPRR